MGDALGEIGQVIKSTDPSRQKVPKEPDGCMFGEGKQQNLNHKNLSANSVA